MSELRDPTRLRDLDPLFDAVIERAHAYAPSASSVEAVVAAVERASAGLHAPSTSPGGFPNAPFGPVSSAGLLKSALLKLSVFAAMSSGVVWILNTGRAPQPAAQSQSQSQSSVTSPSRERTMSSTAPHLAVATATETATAPLLSQPAVPLAPTTPTRIDAAPVPVASPQPASAAPLSSASNAVASAEQGQTPSYAADGARSWPSARRSFSGSAASSGIPRVGERAPAKRARAAADSDDASQSEVDLLEQAQQALRDAPELALALTAHHQHEHPHGAFVQEREQIAIEALFDLGDLGAVRARASRFRKRYPKSAHTARIEALLDAASPSRQGTK